MVGDAELVINYHVSVIDLTRTRSRVNRAPRTLMRWDTD
jgi:hypothetical protein